MGTLEQRKEYYARMLSPTQACLHGAWRSDIRFNKAMEEKAKPWEKPSDYIVNACSEALKFFGLTGNVNQIDVSGLKHLPRMNDNQIFIKLTESGRIAVVGHGKGSTFLIPKCAEEYDEQSYDSYGKLNWKYNSPGILLHSVKERYNENLIILISVDVPAGLQIRDVKRGIGNFLTESECSIPCIDFFNHRVCRREEVKK